MATGTTGLPTLVADINLGADGSVPERLTVAGDTLYFLATTASTGQELWRYDGTGGPTLVADLYPGTGSGVPSVSAALVAFGNEVVFQGRTDISGDELFAFDGTTLKEFDIYPDEPFCAPGCSSQPYGLTVYNGVVYFGAADRDGGVELFRYNGTYQRLTDIVPGAGPAFPEWFTGVGNRLVFAAYGADGRNQLYSYDIVAGGEPTKLVTGAAGFGAFPQNFASDGIRAYFSADDP